MTNIVTVLKHAKKLVQYATCSAASAIVDVVTYGVLVKWVLADIPFGMRLLLAAVIARIVSSVVNYACNRQLPFMQNKNIKRTAVRYYMLWSVQLFASFVGVWGLCAITPLDEITVKFIVDICLAAASYQIQLQWVFCNDVKPRIAENKVICKGEI